MLDGWYQKFPENKKKLGLDNVPEKLQEEEWLWYIKHSDFVITDSFHGTCMAVLFHKPFIAIGNPERGTSRFESLLGSLDLNGRYVERAEQILEKPELLETVDYKKVDEILEKERVCSRNWLKEALQGKKQEPAPSSWKLRAKAEQGKACTEYYLKAAARKLLKR